MANYTQVHQLRYLGLTIEAIAHQVGVGKRTVQRYLQAEAFPERSRRRRSPCPVDAFTAHLKQRTDEGCRDVAQLFREIQALGFRGGYTTVWSALANTAQDRSKSQGSRGRASPLSVPSGYCVASWLQGYVSTKPEVRRHQQAFLMRLCHLAPSLEEAHVLARQFVQIVKQRQSALLPGWLEQARNSQAAELRCFALGLSQDLAAVTAAVSQEWSNGQTEGQVNRIKMLKRQMSGRASFGLLRARVLAVSERPC